MIFVHKIMLTKYEVLTRIQLRYLEWQKNHFSWLNIGERVTSNTFVSSSQRMMSRTWGFSRIFRNPSNFDELYLRAQEIFFQNSKRFEEIYVQTLN